MSETRDDRLYERAILIEDQRAHGFWMPILQHLAPRGHVEAMVVLADRYARPYANDLGRLADPFSAFGLYRRAYRKGSAHAAYNLAMFFFARRDLKGYRQWLRRAARAGDATAGLPFRRFETRRPHANARRIGRLRPDAKRDEFL